MTHIIAIDDGKAGHKSQINGVVSYLNDYKTTFFGFKKSIFNYGPFLLYKLFATFRLLQELYDADDSFIIVSVGKRTLYQSLYIKNLLINAGKNVKLVYLMPPTLQNKYLKHIDLIFYHSYKFNKIFLNNSKFFPIDMAPHSLNIDKYEVSEEFKKFKKSGYAVLIGGDAKSIKFSKKSVDSLLSLLIKINKVNDNQAKFLISTSARTPNNIGLYLKQSLEKSLLTYKLFLYNQNIYNNPYKQIVACCDNILVSGESVSMISECCSLLYKNIYIFFNKDFYAKRYTLFHKMLYKNNYANSCEDIFTSITPQNKINITKEVAFKIKSFIT